MLATLIEIIKENHPDIYQIEITSEHLASSNTALTQIFTALIKNNHIQHIIFEQIAFEDSSHFEQWKSALNHNITLIAINFNECTCNNPEILQIFKDIIPRNIELQEYIDTLQNPNGSVFAGKIIQHLYDTLVDTDSRQLKAYITVNNNSFKSILFEYYQAELAQPMSTFQALILIDKIYVLYNNEQALFNKENNDFMLNNIQSRLNTLINPHFYTQRIHSSSPVAAELSKFEPEFIYQLLTTTFISIEINNIVKRTVSNYLLLHPRPSSAVYYFTLWTLADVANEVGWQGTMRECTSKITDLKLDTLTESAAYNPHQFISYNHILDAVEMLMQSYCDDNNMILSAYVYRYTFLKQIGEIESYSPFIVLFLLSIPEFRDCIAPNLIVTPYLLEEITLHSSQEENVYVTEWDIVNYGDFSEQIAQESLPALIRFIKHLEDKSPSYSNLIDTKIDRMTKKIIREVQKKMDLTRKLASDAPEVAQRKTSHCSSSLFYQKSIDTLAEEQRKRLKP